MACSVFGHILKKRRGEVQEQVKDHSLGQAKRHGAHQWWPERRKKPKEKLTAWAKPEDTKFSLHSLLKKLCNNCNEISTMI